jgi:agmatinase
LRGAAAAPALIREALHSPAANYWSELGVEVRELIDDAGDATLPESGEARTAIESAVGLLSSTSVPIFLGGDHSITYPLVRAWARARGAFEILHVDAHPDTYDNFEGDRYSHACPFARILEEGLTKRLRQIGIRTQTAHQLEQVERFGIEVVTMREWARGRRTRPEGPVYLSIDIDGIDPAFAPGVSHREPGGLTVREVLDVIHELDVPIVGADIVEYNPAQDVAGMTALVAAKLVKEIAGKVAAQ